MSSHAPISTFEPLDRLFPRSEAPPRERKKRRLAEAPPRILRHRRDLAALAAPRYLWIAPRRARAASAAAAGVLVLGGTAILLRVLARGSLPFAVEALPAAFLLVLAGLALQSLMKPWDAAAWIGFAAAGDGLYLPGRGRRVVFVPWFAVAEVGTGRRGGRETLSLSLRLDETNWARVSRFARVEGEERLRTFHLAVPPGTARQTAARIAALNPFI